MSNPRIKRCQSVRVRGLLLSLVALCVVTGCGAESSTNTSLSPHSKRTPRESLQVIAEEMERRTESFDQILSIGGRDMRIEFLFEEITAPSFHEPKNKQDYLTAEIIVRTRSIVTPLAAPTTLKNGSDSERPSPATSLPEKKDSLPAGDKNSEKPETELQKIVKRKVARKYQNYSSENSVTLEFEYADGRWVLTNTDVSKAILKVVEPALELQ